MSNYWFCETEYIKEIHWNNYILMFPNNIRVSIWEVLVKTSRSEVKLLYCI